LWVGGLLLALALALFHAKILAGVAHFMTIRDPLEKADLIVLLYHAGDVPFAASALHRGGYAPRLALARTRPTRLEALGVLAPRHETWRRLLAAEGVPATAIVTVGSQIANEEQLGRALAAFLGSGRVIVVASAPWSRLSLNALRRGLSGAPIDIRMYPVRPKKFDERSWWRSRHGWITYFDAYVLWLLRWLRG
jgi:hypothetical protein